MQKLHFSTIIKAPREKVWHTMLDAQSYQEWATAFNPGSSYKGDWSKGSKMLFVGPDPKTGEEGGMVCEIVENRPNEYISIAYKGFVRNGVEDTSSDAAQQWVGVHENYTFNEKDGDTELLIDIDVADEFVKDFSEMWPKALENLKALAEK